ncbi:MAG TPA: L-threonine 3-dehydrogenase, partial [Chloroflexi bacterium]|nr:L-threonine 3-dehydrogenase [Chloroflexota bacterium]
MAQMQAVAKLQAGPGMELIQKEVPEIGPRDVLIKVQATSICGTDVHIYKWDRWSQGRIKPPLIVGHEFTGEIIAVGEQVRLDEPGVGDYVSAESHIVCGVCQQCRLGMGHICPNTRIIGVDIDGCYAEYVAIPVENAWRNPSDMPVPVASLQENFGNAVHTVAATDVRGKTVLVTGCGPAGLMSIPVARAFGAEIIVATDLSPYRLELARKVGADLAVNPAEEDLFQKAQDTVRGKGFDVLIEMSGAPAALVQGLKLLKPGAEAALLGLAPGTLNDFDLNNLVIMKGITVHGIAGRRLWETWYQMRALIASGAVDLRPIITHEFPLSRWHEAMETMASGNSGKIVMYPGA